MLFTYWSTDPKAKDTNNKNNKKDIHFICYMHFIDGVIKKDLLLCKNICEGLEPIQDF